MSLFLAKEATGEDVIIYFKGALDQTADFPVDKYRLSQQIIFECENLTSINSMGIKRWTDFMDRQDPRQQFVFRNCKQAVLKCFSSIEGFLPKNYTVESFYLPYECEKCEFEEGLLVRRGRDYVESVDKEPVKKNFPIELNCPKCQGSMKQAVWDKRFFSFLERKVENATSETSEE